MFTDDMIVHVGKQQQQQKTLLKLISDYIKVEGHSGSI